MKKSITLLLLVTLTFSLNAQKRGEKKAVRVAVQNFFKGFHKGDTLLLKKTISKDIIAQTTFTNQKGINELKSTPKAYETLINFAKSVKPTDTYDEKILSYTIHVDGNLASVWTLYEFYNNEKFSHCGVNSFQLFNNNGNWEIIYLVDTRRKNDCKAPQK
ncbi:hypothetical protein KCTC32516_00689 [Polaribacter huanghezhanensis]|uniref:nuclear transport factor 2 family protein n=1 Tax=Polaribacter huanghezhanensis TaxID=1354726 RepID=UPI002649213D|nr:nuclear transport factor 2 family protein [Polaribacter huanghezhanensis]WKD85349.1 hypothetical protein KCTC32516_00689 [Polaribacter huanghezhanensis]